MVFGARPLTRQPETWLGRQVVVGQVDQSGVPPFLGLRHTDSRNESYGPPSAGGLIVTVTVVWVVDALRGSSDQLR